MIAKASKADEFFAAADKEDVILSCVLRHHIREICHISSYL